MASTVCEDSGLQRFLLESKVPEVAQGATLQGEVRCRVCMPEALEAFASLFLFFFCFVSSTA